MSDGYVLRLLLFASGGMLPETLIAGFATGFNYLWAVGFFVGCLIGVNAIVSYQQGRGVGHITAFLVLDAIPGGLVGFLMAKLFSERLEIGPGFGAFALPMLSIFWGLVNVLAKAIEESLAKEEAVSPKKAEAIEESLAKEEAVYLEKVVLRAARSVIVSIPGVNVLAKAIEESLAKEEATSSKKAEATEESLAKEEAASLKKVVLRATTTVIVSIPGGALLGFIIAALPVPTVFPRPDVGASAFYGMLASVAIWQLRYLPQWRNLKKSSLMIIEELRKEQARLEDARRKLKDALGDQQALAGNLLHVLEMTYREPDELSKSYDEYRFSLEDAIKLRPEDVRLYLTLGKVLMLEGQGREATTVLRRALEIDGDDPDVLRLYDVLVGTEDIKLVSAFFRACGFAPVPRSPTKLIVVASEERYIQYGKIPIHINVRGSIKSKDIADVFKEAREEYGDQIKGKIAFIVVSSPPEQPVLYQIYTHKFEDGLTIIPLSETLIRQAMMSSTCPQTLNSQIRTWIGEEDLYDLTNPITDPLDFFGRNLVLDELRNYIERGQPIALLGLRRIGKTSVLYQLKELLSGYPVAYVDLQYEQRRCDPLYGKIIEQLVADSQVKLGEAQLPEMWLPKREEMRDLTSIFDHDVSMLAKSFRDKYRNDAKVVLLLDEIDHLLPSSPTANDGFDGFKDFLRIIVGISQRAGGFLVPLVCGVRPTVSRVRAWGTESNVAYQVFKEVPLGPFRKQECAQMIRNIGQLLGLTYKEEALERIYKASGGHPFIARKIGSFIYRNAKVRPLEVGTRLVAEAEWRCAMGMTDYWEYVWEHFTGVERAVAKQLASRSSGSRDDLFSYLLLDEAESEKALQDLSDYGVVTASGDEFTLSSELFRRWIIEMRPAIARIGQ